VAAVRNLLASPAGRLSMAAVAVLLGATVAGLAILWPTDTSSKFQPTVVGTAEKARVTFSADRGCQAIAGPGCRLLGIELLDGPNEGKKSFITLPGDELAPDVDPGDRIRVARNVPAGLSPEQAEKLPVDRIEDQAYGFVDFERERPLLILAILFGFLVVALGRRRGVLSLIGLGVSLLLVVRFVVPAILDGGSPLAVALVGSMAIMLATLLLTHGLGPKSVAAALGTAGSLALTAALAVLFTELAHITGFSSEEATLLLGAREGKLSLQGLVLAGMVIGALGVLDDVTVSQASTVLALRRANPGQRLAELYSGALAVGRDHLGATVNTLVLAYAGAALPILLIFSNQSTSFGEAVNREPVAIEVVSMLVGSIGLIAAVPLTTALAALLATRLSAEDIPAEEPAHAH
jgi:uncharacterized membrane protein